jgi:hypothetical protein
MIQYAIVKPSPATDTLAAQLAARGATPGPIEHADIVLAAVESVEDAGRVLASLGDAATAALLLGPLPQVRVTEEPAPGNVEGILETHRPFGILRSSPNAAWNAMAAGFTGPKALGESTGAGVMKAFTTPSYGAWLRCDAADAGDFILRLIRARADGANAP